MMNPAPVMQGMVWGEDPVHPQRKFYEQLAKVPKPVPVPVPFWLDPEPV